MLIKRLTSKEFTLQTRFYREFKLEIKIIILPEINIVIRRNETRRNQVYKQFSFEARCVIIRGKRYGSLGARD